MLVLPNPKQLYSLNSVKYAAPGRSGGEGGVLPYKRLMGMCHWTGSHFQEVARMGSPILDFFG